MLQAFRSSASGKSKIKTNTSIEERVGGSGSKKPKKLTISNKTAFKKTTTNETDKKKIKNDLMLAFVNKNNRPTTRDKNRGVINNFERRRADGSSLITILRREANFIPQSLYEKHNCEVLTVFVQEGRLPREFMDHFVFVMEYIKNCNNRKIHASLDIVLDETMKNSLKFAEIPEKFEQNINILFVSDSDDHRQSLTSDNQQSGIEVFRINLEPILTELEKKNSAESSNINLSLIVILFTSYITSSLFRVMEMEHLYGQRRKEDEVVFLDSRVHRCTLLSRIAKFTGFRLLKLSLYTPTTAVVKRKAKQLDNTDIKDLIVSYLLTSIKMNKCYLDLAPLDIDLEN